MWYPKRVFILMFSDTSNSFCLHCWQYSKVELVESVNIRHLSEHHSPKSEWHSIKWTPLATMWKQQPSENAEAVFLLLRTWVKIGKNQCTCTVSFPSTCAVFDYANSNIFSREASHLVLCITYNKCQSHIDNVQFCNLTYLWCYWIVHYR